MATLDQRGDRTAKTIIVLRNDQHLETRSWQCNNVGEADSMKRWLRDNHLACDVLSLAEWDVLNAGPRN